LDVKSSTYSKFTQTIVNGWLASLQHQFVSAIVPPAINPSNTSLRSRQGNFERTGPATRFPPAPKRNSARDYSSSQITVAAAATAPHLERTVELRHFDRARAAFVRGLNWVMAHRQLGCPSSSSRRSSIDFYPLSQASGRSMAKMRTVQRA